MLLDIINDYDFIVDDFSICMKCKKLLKEIEFNKVKKNSKQKICNKCRLSVNLSHMNSKYKIRHKNNVHLIDCTPYLTFD